MPQTNETKVFLKDYKVSEYLIDNVDLSFELDPHATVVNSKIKFYANPLATERQRTLLLNGEDLETTKIMLNEKVLTAAEYSIKDNVLRIFNCPDNGVVETTVKINPEGNSLLMGLYYAEDTLITQCEAEGFRRITWYLDRPDVLAKFKVRLIADKEKYPVLLSNGNRVSERNLDGKKHEVLWEDPFPKPAYLFALVAGNLKKNTDYFITKSNRKVTIDIYAKEDMIPRITYAMECIKKAMKWDEDKYGLEYDLDLFQIVSTPAFNFGAMENKGLNIFNATALLADKNYSTDADFLRIDSIIAHEYFHNWTGDRVTLRDWFQLSLKEGLTSYRDNTYSEDIYARGPIRISQVLDLRDSQFTEDTGPKIHPVRPEFYVSIDNFYTATVYDKGAEIIRMYATLLGEETFIKGVQYYLKQNDGKAATIEDFVAAHEKTSGKNLQQFKRWYSQPGRPEVTIVDKWDSHTNEFTVIMKQNCPPTQGYSEKLPFVIPVRMALLGRDGNDQPLYLKGSEGPDEGNTTRVVVLDRQEQQFVFKNLKEKPVPSYFRHFSAPITLNYDADFDDLMFRIKFDRDDFNRWDAGQQMAQSIFFDLIEQKKRGEQLNVNGKYLIALRTMLQDPNLSLSMKSQMLNLPSFTFLESLQTELNLDLWLDVYRGFEVEIAKYLEKDLLDTYLKYSGIKEYKITKETIGERELKTSCMHYLCMLKNEKHANLCVDQYKTANNMTDARSAMMILANSEFGQKEEVLASFYNKWKNEYIVIRNWLVAVASDSFNNNLIPRLSEIMADPAFNIKFPNHVRSLIGTYRSNHHQFHKLDGSGYRFVADFVIKYDKINKNVAANIAHAFQNCKKYGPKRYELMLAEIKRILETQGISANTREILELFLK